MTVEPRSVVKSCGPLTAHLMVIIFNSARLTVSTSPSTLPSWRGFRRRSCVGSMSSIRKGRRDCPTGKISPTWWRRKWPRRNKKWIATASEMGRRARSLSSDVINHMYMFLYSIFHCSQFDCAINLCERPPYDVAVMHVGPETYRRCSAPPDPVCGSIAYVPPQPLHAPPRVVGRRLQYPCPK